MHEIVDGYTCFIVVLAFIVLCQKWRNKDVQSKSFILSRVEDGMEDNGIEELLPPMTLSMAGCWWQPIFYANVSYQACMEEEIATAVNCHCSMVLWGSIPNLYRIILWIWPCFPLHLGNCLHNNITVPIQIISSNEFCQEEIIELKKGTKNLQWIWYTQTTNIPKVFN